MDRFLSSVKSLINEINNVSVTENGAIGYSTSGKTLVDINFSVASLRNVPDKDVQNKIHELYIENPMIAVKWIFFAGDVREGLGERRLFRLAIKQLISENPEVVKRVLKLIPEYTRWDNLVLMISCNIIEKDILEIIKQQLMDDMNNCKTNKPISLLAKWMPSINTSNKDQVKLARFIAHELHIKQSTYRKMLSKLRSYSNVTETLVSSNQWDKINYEAVPSKANLLYKDAFLKHDNARRTEYLDQVTKGEKTINSSVAFPCDIVHKYYSGNIFNNTAWKIDMTLESMWSNLPNYVNGDDSTIVVSDGSGSMLCRCGGKNSDMTALEVAMSIAIYFSERCKGVFKDKYITFSEKPKFVDFSNCNSLNDKLHEAARHNECQNTNIEGVFTLILKAAVENDLSQEELPKNILIISDMEFDYGATINNRSGWNYSIDIYGTRDNHGQIILPSRNNYKLFERIKSIYESYGYKMPKLIFWNVNSRTNTIPVIENDLGVALVSGYSTNIVKMVLSGKLDPYEIIIEQLNNKRYDKVEEAISDILR